MVPRRTLLLHRDADLQARHDGDAVDGRLHVDDIRRGRGAAAGELLADTGGVTYGQDLPNSPHGRLVGTSPVKDPADATVKVEIGDR